MVLQTSADPRDLFNGAVLQCVEAATLGMPLEVWKTRMGRFRNENSIEAFQNVYRRAGIGGFWRGTSAKMVESASKGAILLFAKESILSAMVGAGQGQVLSGIVAGAGAGACQTTVLGPCTFIVTAVVTGDKNMSITRKIKDTWRAHGVKGFYPGGLAIALRQSTNWASRQGFTEYIRGKAKERIHGDRNANLTNVQEAMCGLLGGALSTWNQPFEVARIQMQAAASAGEPKVGLVTTLSTVVREYGPQGLFKGIVPRIMLGMWQTVFMVSGAKVLKQYLA
eukprot:GEMP01058955.1.p1 GENE.GEMP01058955.1~~GEMP01058955.1.p1  ORF type:complete len:288 (+),score=51.26 GEMP01058955.1:22-864(+)